MEEESRPLARILSLDGGGIRGVITAVILDEIEKRTKKPICELFDLIAGTSTGGILAAGLTVPDKEDISKPKHTAERMVEFYRKEGKVIFGNKASLPKLLYRAYHKSDRIESVLQSCLGKDVFLSSAVQNILITSYEIETGMPMLFNSRRAKTDDGWNYRLWEVARATSAAPAYFQPYKLKRSAGEGSLIAGNDDPLTGVYEEWPVDYYALVDGGVFANNPTMCAFAEANRFRGDKLEKKLNEQKYFIISIGTGETRKGIPLQKVEGSGLNWMNPQKGFPVIDAMFQSSSESVDALARKICSHKPDEYHRIQTVIAEKYSSLDDITDENLKGLVKSATDWIENRSDYLDVLCNQLTTYSQKPATYIQ